LSIQEFAPWQNVHDYLQKYADLFHITERIRFQTRVISIEKNDLKNDTVPWIIKVETISGHNETFEFDLVVVASGLHSIPNIPNFRGQNKFSGEITYPFTVKSHAQLANKRVLVTGSGKSAADMAVLAGRFARSCHLVFRKAHWATPRAIMGGYVPLRYLWTRASTISSSPYPDAPHTNIFRFLHRKFPKFATKMSNGTEADIIASHGTDLYGDKIFIPQHSFQNENNLSVLPKDFIRLKKEGRIIGKLASIDEIVDETTIRLDSGEELQADMIICATGFIRRFPFFSEKHAQMMDLMTTSDGNAKTNLYRRILPVGIPNIGFIGFTSSTDHWMIAEVASHWLSDYFLKRLKLPSNKEMYAEIERRTTFLNATFGGSEHEISYYWAGPLDIYLQDMGLTVYRTNNWISEYFGIYRPDRFKGLHEERRIKAETGVAPRHFYFSFEHTICLVLLLICLYLIF
jgi:dimethylaniline monooxygenase (N-oxide forming)